MRRLVDLLFPGISLLGVLLIASIGLRSVPVLFFAVVFVYVSGLMPIAAMIAIAVVSIFYWRRHWISGVSILCAAPLVFALNVYPQPVTSPVEWAANAVKVLYYYRDLQRSYLEAQTSGQTSPVGQVYTDGFGSLVRRISLDNFGMCRLNPFSSKVLQGRLRRIATKRRPRQNERTALSGRRFAVWRVATVLTCL